MTDNQIRNEISRLESQYGSYKSKCLRNLRLYTYSPNLSLSLSDTEVVGYYQRGTFDIESDTTSMIQENIIRSCIDTLTALAASKKVRPFFNTVDGTFKDIQLAKQTQLFFDQLYDEKHVLNTVINVFRDACIFDKGIVKIDIKNLEIKRIMPWTVYFDSMETIYDKQTKCVEKCEKVPGRLLKLKYNIDPKSSIEYYTVYEYYDVYTHTKAIYISELAKVYKTEYKPKVLPYIIFNYSDPVKGTTDQSIVDVLYGIQMQVDELLTVIKDSIQMNPGVTFFVPNSSSIKTNMLSNRTGQIVTYDAMQGQPPVVAQSNDIISAQFIQLLDKLKADAYELIGISELSAMAKKPHGLNSGVALETLENAEAGRQEVIISNIVHLYVEIAKRCIDTIDPNADILPNAINRNRLQWKDIIEARNKLNIQFSAADSLSKDPSTKLSQLVQLAQAGVIPQSAIGRLMELPDLQAGYNLANNAYSAVCTYIEDTLDNKQLLPIPPYLPIEMLKDEVVNTILSLSKNKENANDINLLYQLFSQIVKNQGEMQTNAEMAATQMISQELQQAMPQITQQGQLMAEATILMQDDPELFKTMLNTGLMKDIPGITDNQQAVDTAANMFMPNEGDIQ